MKNINNYIDESLTKSYDSNILIKDLETLINENYKEVILPNGQQIKLQIL